MNIKNILNKSKESIKTGLDKGVDYSKELYELSKKRAKSEIHKQRKKVALSVIDETIRKVKSNRQKTDLKLSEFIIKDNFEKGGGIGKIDNNTVFIVLSKTKNGLLISERFKKPITNKEVYEFYKEKGYEIIDSEIFEVTNEDALDVYKNIVSKYVLGKYKEQVDWDETLINYEIVGKRIILKDNYIETKNGNKHFVTIDNLFSAEEYARGGNISKIKIKTNNKLVAEDILSYADLQKVNASQKKVGNYYLIILDKPLELRDSMNSEIRLLLFPKLAKGGKIAKVMHEFKEGTLHIGKSDKLVKDPKQAIAIGLSEERRMDKGGSLVGKQKNLDRNNNGKIDSEDLRMIRENKMAKGGGIYSSDDRWIVTFQNQDNGEFEKVIVRANNKKNAIAIAEDESGLNSDWYYYSAEKQMEHGGSMGSNNKNSKYLDSIPSDKKSKILKNIASHYGISVADAEGEVRDADAEMLYEYIANDQLLRMEVYNDMKKGMMAKGGIVYFKQGRDAERTGRPQGDIEKEILEKVKYFTENEELFVGNFGWRTPKPYDKLADGYLYKLEEYDLNLIKDIKIKSGEKVFRYLNRSTAISGSVPFIKINLDKGLLYWTIDNEYDEINFDTKGYPALWVNILSDKMAQGGSIEDENREMVLNDNNQIIHHTKELPSAIKGKRVPAWVVANVNESANNLSDATHYMDGQKMANGGGVHIMPNGKLMLDSEHYANGGFVGKGEMVWKKLNSNERIDFLYKNFTPIITPRSQEILVGKTYNFLPKSVKIKIESEYANKEEYENGGGVLSNEEIIKDIDFEDNTDRKHGRYDFSFTTYDKQGAEILDYDGYIIESPSSSRMNDEIEWGQNTPEDWESAEKILIDAFYEWKNKKYEKGGSIKKYKKPTNDIKTTGVYKFKTKDKEYTLKVTYFERENDTEDSLAIQDDLRSELGSIIIKNSSWNKLSKGENIIAYTSKGGNKGVLKRIDDINNFNKYAKGGSVAEHNKAIFDEINKERENKKGTDNYTKFDFNDKGNFEATIDGNYYEVINRSDDSGLYDLYKNGELIDSDMDLRKLMKFETSKPIDTENSIGFLPMDLEEELIRVSKWGNISIRETINILNAIVDSGLTTEEIKPILPKSTMRHMQIRDNKTKEVWSKIEKYYKGNLKGNQYFQVLHDLISKKPKLIDEFRPFRKMQKFEKGGIINNGQYGAIIDWQNFTLNELNAFLKYWSIGEGEIEINLFAPKGIDYVKSVDYKKYGNEKLSVGDVGKQSKITKGSENIYLDITVYNEKNEEYVIGLYSKENHNGLKQIAKDLIDKYEKGGTINQPIKHNMTQEQIEKFVGIAKSTNKVASEIAIKKLKEAGLDANGKEIKAEVSKQVKKVVAKKVMPKKEKTTPKKVEKNAEPDCDDLYEQYKKRKMAQKKAKQSPQKTETTKNKEKIEKVEDSLDSRFKAGKLTKKELQKMYNETKVLLEKIKKYLQKL
jgi:hypothetical protein